MKSIEIIEEEWNMESKIACKDYKDLSTDSSEWFKLKH